MNLSASPGASLDGAAPDGCAVTRAWYSEAMETKGDFLSNFTLMKRMDKTSAVAMVVKLDIWARRVFVDNFHVIPYKTNLHD